MIKGWKQVSIQPFFSLNLYCATEVGYTDRAVGTRGIIISSQNSELPSGLLLILPLASGVIFR
ncbi:hypothetical protein LV84_00191 [Algoriphagus ratkowskyi]|uniref:Uncharacterized protein n=1 Tax=Algoriphagus ratkowskyi TaxID=57028 RepID=A0A2W7RK49_9BACT|nr:hypothetical protein LV84_00191 [Algoriphagus ratkowskyi]